MPNKKMYTGLDANGNKITGLPTPTVTTDAATKAYVDTKSGASKVNNVSPDANGNVTLTATNIAISDPSNNFPTDTVQSAIDSLFTFANSGKTQIANAIGSPAQATDSFSTLAGYITNIGNAIYGTSKQVKLDETVANKDIIKSYYRDMAHTKLNNPDTLPGGTSAFCVDFSDNGYVAIGSNSGTNPRFVVYVPTFNGSGTAVYTKIADVTAPATQPTAQVNGIALSKNADFLALGSAGTTNLWIYRRTNQTFSNSGVTITGAVSQTGRACEFSPDGTLLAFGHNLNAGSGVSVYIRGGNTFTKATDPTTLANGNVYGVSWSSDGTYLACVTDATATPTVFVYKWLGTQLSLVWSSPINGAGRSVAFSPDDAYLAVGYASAPFMTVFKKSGETWSTTGVTIPTFSSTVNGLSWSPEGVYLGTAHSSFTFAGDAVASTATILKRVGDTFTRKPQPTTQPSGNGNGISFSFDQKYYAVAHANSPLVSFYYCGDPHYIKSTSNGTIQPYDIAQGIAKAGGNAGETITADIIIGGGAT